MPTIAVNGYGTHYYDAGRGPPVVLVHSSSSSGGQWRELIERLSGRYRCLAPDLIGYGRTDAWDPDRGTRLYDDEIAIIDAMLDRAGEKVHLVGHSYGGLLAGLARVKEPDRIKTLTMIEPTVFTFLRDAGDEAAFSEIESVGRLTRDLTDAGDPESAARAFLDYWVAPGALDVMLDQTRKAIIATMPKQRHEWPFWQDLQLPTLEEFAETDCPVQIIRADRTTLAASRCVDLLLAAMPAAEFTEIEGAGHMSPVTDPEKVNPVIEAFLDAHRA